MTRHPGTSSRGVYDDLTVIKGIGALTQEWLRATFAVRTYADLAALSPDDLEERLKADGKITARSRIEEWLVQAQQLSAPAARFDMPDVGVHDASAWKTYAQFVIVVETRPEADGAEFRTKAHHMEADRGQTWPGITAAEPGRWMAEQMGLPGEVRVPVQSEFVQPEPVLDEYVPLPAVSAEPPIYSAELERHIAKVHELDRRVQSAGTPSTSIPKPSRPRELSQARPAAAGLYSTELERHIAKAGELERRALADTPSWVTPEQPTTEPVPQMYPAAAGLYSATLELYVEKARRLSGKS